MFRAIGLILLLWFLSNVFATSFDAFNGAMTATFNAVESAAHASEQQLEILAQQ